jgi:hypothetical protein
MWKTFKQVINYLKTVFYTIISGIFLAIEISQAQDFERIVTLVIRFSADPILN